MELDALYRPMTASPYRRDAGYWESPPCAALRPYIRCFWRSAPAKGTPEGRALVIPDTCMDILFYADPICGGLTSVFCALNDAAYHSGPSQAPIVFAVRFYPWAAALFARDSLSQTLNAKYDAEQHFPSLTRRLSPLLERCATFAARQQCAEACLLALLDGAPPSGTFLNVLLDLLCHDASLSVTGLARNACLSTRQLERLSERYTGMPPKRLSSLIRYQLVWQDALRSSRFSVQDAVFRYGYADQAHLLNAFRRFHSMSLRRALALARQDVAFIQDAAPLL